jgi:hypothetical protein
MNLSKSTDGIIKKYFSDEEISSPIFAALEMMNITSNAQTECGICRKDVEGDERISVEGNVYHNGVNLF